MPHDAVVDVTAASGGLVVHQREHELVLLGREETIERLTVGGRGLEDAEELLLEAIALGTITNATSGTGGSITAEIRIWLGDGTIVPSNIDALITSQLVFDDTNWNIPQIVTVEGVDDAGAGRLAQALA